MFNRRYLRIKVFQSLYAYWQDAGGSRALHEKNLLKSLERAHDLFLFLLAFPSELRFALSKELDIQKAKHIPSTDLISLLQAVHDNKAVQWLDGNEKLKEAVKDKKYAWTNSETLFRELVSTVKTSEAVKAYMGKESHSFTDDKKLLGELLEIFIGESESFDHYIEDRFMNWEDDQVLVVSLLLKTIGQLKEDNTQADIVAEGDDSSEREDREMMLNLFHKTIESNDEFESLIAKKTQNWEADRIAMADMLLMKMALCEILMFPYIPVKVSINEYLELAKMYSTPNSHGFINGILDKIQLDLRRENRIVKQGRGLVE